MPVQFDDFDAQVQCEDVQQEYVPTEQDLQDMGVAFSMSEAEFEGMVIALEKLFGGLDNPF